jgi:hypothetical protein
MRLYFSRIVADHWCAKNKLQDAGHRLAKEMDRRIVTADQVLDFKAEFLDKVERLNREYPRCTPLFLSIIANPMDKGDIDFWIDGVFNMCLFLAKE